MAWNWWLGTVLFAAIGVVVHVSAGLSSPAPEKSCDSSLTVRLITLLRRRPPALLGVPSGQWHMQAASIPLNHSARRAGFASYSEGRPSSAAGCCELLTTQTVSMILSQTQRCVAYALILDAALVPGTDLLTEICVL